MASLCLYASEPVSRDPIGTSSRPVIGAGEAAALLGASGTPGPAGAGGSADAAGTPSDALAATPSNAIPRAALLLRWPGRPSSAADLMVLPMPVSPLVGRRRDQMCRRPVLRAATIGSMSWGRRGWGGRGARWRSWLLPPGSPGVD